MTANICYNNGPVWPRGNLSEAARDDRTYFFTTTGQYGQVEICRERIGMTAYVCYNKGPECPRGVLSEAARDDRAYLLQ